jgi:mRNA interferase RelE/StbE
MIKYDFTRTAEREFFQLSPAVQKRIIKKLEFYLSQADPLSFAKHIATPISTATYRFRIGDYRLIFDREVQGILILRVGHRSEIYRR